MFLLDTVSVTINIHRFMDLSEAEFSYFVSQVAASAASFGVATADLTAVGMALNTAFGYKCSPPATIVPAQGAQLQSMCTGEGCPLDPKSDCAMYQTNITEPMMANGTSSSGGGSMGSPTMGGASSTGSMPAQASTAGAAANSMSFAALVGGLFAMIL